MHLNARKREWASRKASRYELLGVWQGVAGERRQKKNHTHTTHTQKNTKQRVTANGIADTHTHDTIHRPYISHSVREKNYPANLLLCGS
jgi:hypothetical protein